MLAAYSGSPAGEPEGETGEIVGASFAAVAERDAGTVPEGDPLAETFTVSDRSAGSVDISGVSAGCSCRSADGLPTT